MSFSLNELNAFAEEAASLVQNGRFQNFIAQSHSRDVLRHLEVPETDWPTYATNIDESLSYAAQTLLYLGMRLKDTPAAPGRGDPYLTIGAEILEYIHARARPEDPERVCQLFTAALAYYMSGHFARAFVLIRDLEAEARLPRFLHPIRHLILKDFGKLRTDVLNRLISPEYGDAQIAGELERGEIDEDQALCRVLEATLFRALSYFLEHAKSGDEKLIETAELLLDAGIAISVHHRFADWWWYFECVRTMLGTFRRHSFWMNLSPFFAETAFAPLARRYVQANFRLPTPVIELWPSQVTAIPYLFGSSTANNICLRMPTSSGKTKIAELAILAHLAANPSDATAKCVYVAPFRSLAVEVEQTLKRAFTRLGVRVSELYGGFELTAADKLLLERTQILVATPEKVDAFLRFTPDIIEQIKLNILDEGHIISPPNFRAIRESRGLKYEVFLQRLVHKFQNTGTRIVFLSAVMPNAEQFAEWITGDPKGLVSSDWRPSRLMIGEAIWDGKNVDVEYTHADQKPLGHKCFIRRFVEQRTETIPGSGRRKPLPCEADEGLALTALKFAALDLTMVFVGRKTSAEPFGRTVLNCIELLRKRALSQGLLFGLHVEPKFKPDIDRCIALIRQYSGNDSDLAKFLNEGYVVHHGSVPQVVRIELEKLVRAGAVRLVIATTTLAQGVNFPIRTILVHSLDHGRDAPVSPMDFWNICGRAGRGMKENEGQILFFVRKAFEEWRKSPSRRSRLANSHPNVAVRWWNGWCEKQAEIRANYIESYGRYKVNSALLELVTRVENLWKEKHKLVIVADLCEALANHTLDLFNHNDGVDLESLLSTLDGLLISITEELKEEEITPDTFQELFRRSLLFLQLDSDDRRNVASEIFAARVRYIHRHHPDKKGRHRFYQLGLPLKDCEKIQEHEKKLVALYLRAEEYDQWSIQERGEHLAAVAEFLFGLSEIAPAEIPSCWRRVLVLWISGSTPNEIAAESEIDAAKFTASKVSRWIDDVFSYRLPWGYNSLGLYVKAICEEDGRSLPPVCEYFSSLIKFGVHQLAACWLLSFGVSSRRVAVLAADQIGPGIDGPEKLLNWLRNGGLDVLHEEGMVEEDLAMIRAAISGYNSHGDVRTVTPAIEIRLRAAPEKVADLTVGDRLIFEGGAAPDSIVFRAFTLRGVVIGSWRITQDETRQLLRKPEFVDVVVKSIEAGEATSILLVGLNPV